MTQPFLYQELDTSQQEIRLLSITSIRNGNITCSREIVSLLTKPTFTALSYVWGDAGKTEDITVSWEVSAATLNLANAPRHVQDIWTPLFRDREPNTFRTWGDAICINQMDPKERTSKVQ